MEIYNYIRTIPVQDGYDLVVAGGGPAGAAAAICAARLGVKVLLVEAMGCLGGMGTSGQVCAFDPMADGEKPLVGGFMREIVETLYAGGYLMPGINPDYWLKDYHRWVPFHPEGLKLTLDDFAIDADVEIRFFTRVIDADFDERNKTVNGVVVQNVEGLKYVKAKTFIDCTGDAVLSKLCGVGCREAGRDTENIMPSTLTSIHSGIDWDRMDQPYHDDRYMMIEKAYAEGMLTQCDRHLPGMSRIGNSLGYLNGGHVYQLDALNCESLTKGMIFGRKIVQEYLRMYRKYVPGCENMELVITPSLMGVRESRRIEGEYELKFDDFITRRSFPDQIGVFNKFIDVHCYDSSKESWERFLRREEHEKLGIGEFFGIPYGILVPRGWKNLWTAGRCASTDVQMQGCIRVMPAAAMMGQAAGTAAAQAIKSNQTAAELDTETLIKTLRAGGAYLPQIALSRNMTRD